MTTRRVPKKTPGNRPPERREIGRRAEKAAAGWLGEQGLKLLQQNYHCRYGEIDIIGRDGDHLVFVEVRFRSNRHFGSPEDSVDYRKQRKLIVTAQHFLRRNRRYGASPCRFDVITATRQSAEDSFDFTWHKNAFDAE